MNYVFVTSIFYKLLTYTYQWDETKFVGFHSLDREHFCNVGISVVFFLKF